MGGKGEGVKFASQHFERLHGDRHQAGVLAGRVKCHTQCAEGEDNQLLDEVNEERKQHGCD